MITNGVVAAVMLMGAVAEDIPPRSGTSFERVGRLVEVVAGAAGGAEPARSTTDLVPDPALDEVLQRVGRYVAHYGEDVSLIIAVEHYRQRYENAPLGEPSGRDLVAELAIVKTSDAIGWVSFRDVIAVDGKPIADRQDRLMRLFRAGTPDVAKARRIADESARFNIGPTRRNFNDPTVALFFLLPGNHARFTFTPKGSTTIDGVAVTEIDFKETGSPTMIRTADAHDVASQGTFWVVPADGTVVRTRLIVSGFAGVGSSARIEATFAQSERLRMWLPVKMTERYEGRVRAPGQRWRPLLPSWPPRPTATSNASRHPRRRRSRSDRTVRIGESREHHDLVFAVGLLAPDDHREPLSEKVGEIDPLDQEPFVRTHGSGVSLRRRARSRRTRYQHSLALFRNENLIRSQCSGSRPNPEEKHVGTRSRVRGSDSQSQRELRRLRKCIQARESAGHELRGF